MNEEPLSNLAKEMTEIQLEQVKNILHQIQTHNEMIGDALAVATSVHMSVLTAIYVNWNPEDGDRDEWLTHQLSTVRRVIQDRNQGKTIKAEDESKPEA